MSDVYEAADAGLFDLSAAFDTVTIAFYSIDSGTTTVSGDWSFSGSSPISHDALNSCGSTGSTQTLYQSPPVCRRGPSKPPAEPGLPVSTAIPVTINNKLLQSIRINKNEAPNTTNNSTSPVFWSLAVDRTVNR